MSFSLFNQDTGLKEGPSPYPLPQERKKEADLPGKGGARPESKGKKGSFGTFGGSRLKSTDCIHVTDSCFISKVFEYPVIGCDRKSL